MKLTYERLFNTNNIISIDLHNGYSIIAISGRDRTPIESDDDTKSFKYTTTLFLKADTINDWKMINDDETLEFIANDKTVNSAILKSVSKMLSEKFFDPHFERYEFELKCAEIGVEKIEKERMENIDVQ